MEPKWLQWAKQILATSQAGLTYTKMYLIRKDISNKKVKLLNNDYIYRIGDGEDTIFLR